MVIIKLTLALLDWHYLGGFFFYAFKENKIHTKFKGGNQLIYNPAAGLRI